MTKDKILAMEAEPDLDWRVAELVMGLDVPGMLMVTPDHDSPSAYCVPYRQEPHGLDAPRPVYVAHCACDMDERQPSDEDYWGHYAACLEVVPRYSTDIAAAWQVADKLHNSGWWVRVKSAMNEDLEQLGWAAHIGRWWNREYLGTWALTAPLVICRAALLAIMEAES